MGKIVRQTASAQIYAEEKDTQLSPERYGAGSMYSNMQRDRRWEETVM